MSGPWFRNCQETGGKKIFGNVFVGGCHIPPARHKKYACDVSLLHSTIGVIDKTAEFVAKVGDDFEKKVTAQQAGQPKFAFLNAGNPYRKYYEMRIAELREGKDASKPALPKALLDLKAKDEEKRKKREERKMLGDGLVVEYPAPPPFLFKLDHPPIAFIDSDIIKITAQFVARNGAKFLQGLMTRESRNPQFEFLLPEHHLYSYFEALVESYKKVLLLPPEEKERISDYSKSRQAIVDRIHKRYLYLAQEDRRKSDKARAESEYKEAMSRLDWFNFSIVGKLDFPENDAVKLEVPIDPRTRKRFFTGVHVPLASESVLFSSKDHGDSLPEVEESVIEEEIEMEENEPDLIPFPPASMPIRTDYVRAKRSESKETMIKCPITGEMIRESEFSQHLRIVLLDPQWKRQSDIVLKRARQEASSLAQDIGDNISEFIKNRIELFGGVQEEVKKADWATQSSSHQVSIGPCLPPPPEKRQKQ